jgi:23S rRNA pseudouridine1911/1915/1917 synthase
MAASQTLTQTFTVSPAAANQRLDVWLLATLGADHSRAEIQRWIKAGALTLAGQPSLNPAKKVRTGESFTLTPPPPATHPLVAEHIPLAIVYEDDVLLVLNKPAGLTVHPAPGHYTGTLVHALLHHCGAQLSTENGTDRPGIVHRLDKDTSGLLVVAKTAQAHRFLAKQFAAHGRDGRLHRVYLALVRGAPRATQGTMRGNIGRHPSLRLPRAIVATGGKPAITHYRVRQTFGPSPHAAALLELRLETGRTHQIRVHLAALGHPVLGDPLYPSPRGNLGPLTGAARNLIIPPQQLLHAAELGFIHPLTQQRLQFTAPLPPLMQAVMDELSNCFV